MIIRIGNAELEDGDEGQTREETSIRLSDGFSRVRISLRSTVYRTIDGKRTEKIEEQARTSFPLAHLPMVIAALQSIQASKPQE